MFEGKDETQARSVKRKKLMKQIYRHRYVYLMLIPVAAYYIIFHFIPMGGIVVAFKNYKVTRGIWGSEWVGLKYFRSFLESRSFGTIFWNSIKINVLSVVFFFPCGIILAILLNEVRHRAYKKIVQTITYLPHFISVVVLCSIVNTIFSGNGLINQSILQHGGESIPFLTSTKWYRTLFIGSDIWQETGWNSIIYLAAIAGISPELYEAAELDGANWFQRTRHVTLPCIRDTILIMLIIRMGSMMSVGLEKSLLLQNAGNSDVSYVLSTFVYKKGLVECNYGYSTAVSFFDSVVSLVMLTIVNGICKKTSDVSIW